MAINMNAAGGTGSGLEKWIKYGIIAGVLAAPVYYVLQYLTAVSRYINSIAWNTAQAIPPILFVTVVTAPLWHPTLRTVAVNWIDIVALGLAKSFVKTNPVGWLEARRLELGDLVRELDAVITRFRQMIQRLKDEFDNNQKQMARSTALLDAGPEKDFNEIINSFEAQSVGFNFEKLDEYQEALEARNEQMLAETQAVSLEDRNKELEDLARDFVDIIKVMMVMRADMQQLYQHMGLDITMKRNKWELQKSVWGFLKQAHKFSNNALKNMLSEYAGQYVDQRYSDAIAAFKAFKTQGDDVLVQAGQNRRIASVRAKEILTKYRQAKALAEQQPGVASSQISSATQQVRARQ